MITLDPVAPTSHINSLTAQSQLLQVPVSWAGQDEVGGSGVTGYDDFVSDNDGAWTLWQSTMQLIQNVKKGRELLSD